ncbi:MAG: biotin carboxylase N-terminal domain-containing protein [Pyrinomonadaceae bacterium]
MERSRAASYGRAKRWAFARWRFTQEADRDSLHVRFADEAICIGPAPSTPAISTYHLSSAPPGIANVDAIHPGYGFLAESAYFAEICEACNIKFMEPRPDVIRMMGDKGGSATRYAAEAGLSILPGSPEPLESRRRSARPWRAR